MIRPERDVLAVAAFYAGGEEASGTGGSEVAREAAGRVGAPGHAAGRRGAGVALLSWAGSS
jgi:hypothetical protein